MRWATRLALGVALAASPASASAQSAPGEPPRGGSRQSYANPSAVIAAELALSRLAREKGQWRALNDLAARGAVVFAPRAVSAAAWLKRRAEPSEAAQWSPQAVWMSCDGDYAVSRGAWTRGSDGGEYVTVWQRQEKGGWKWLLREEGERTRFGGAPDMIVGRVAACSGLPRLRRLPGDFAPTLPAGAVNYDRSLRWAVEVGPDCARSVKVEVWDGTVLVPVLTARRNPPSAGCT